MDNTKIYGICVGGILAVLIITSFVLSLARRARASIRPHFLSCLYYALLPSWLSSFCGVSRYEVLLFVVFIITNVCCVTIRVTNVAEFTKWLGHACLINLIPLYSGIQLNRIIGKSAIKFDSYCQLHKCLGAVVIFEGALHSVLAAALNNTNVKQTHTIAGLIAISAFGTISILSIPALWRWMFEVFSRLHSALAISALVALWIHLGSTQLFDVPKIYIFVAAILYFIQKAVGFIQTLYHNVSFQGLSSATIQPNGVGVEVRVHICRALRFHVGQYVYLNILRLAAFELHPFQIAWVYLGDDGRQVIVLLVQLRHGFTGRLLLADSNRAYLAFIQGPYGKGIPVDEYGTVLLFATGIGIAGQLLYVKELMDLYRDWKAKSCRIALFWEMELEIHRYWVWQFMDEMLGLDIDYILVMHLFVRGHYLNKDAEEGDLHKLGEHGRIQLHYSPMELERIINSEIRERKGKTLVSFCTDVRTKRVIIDVVRSMLDKDIDIEELDFQPWSSDSSIRSCI